MRYGMLRGAGVGSGEHRGRRGRHPGAGPAGGTHPRAVPGGVCPSTNATFAASPTAPARPRRVRRGTLRGALRPRQRIGVCGGHRVLPARHVVEPAGQPDHRIRPACRHRTEVRARGLDSRCGARFSISRAAAVLRAELASIRRHDPDVDAGEIAGFTLPLLLRVVGIAAVGVVPLMVVRNGSHENSGWFPSSVRSLVLICAAVNPGCCRCHLGSGIPGQPAASSRNWWATRI